MDDLKGRQELYNGFGDTMTRGIELAVTPFLFGGIGFGLDVLFGTKPLLTIVFAVFAIVGLSVRTYYGYQTAMRAHEANMPWARRPIPRPADPDGVTVEPGAGGSLDDRPGLTAVDRAGLTAEDRAGLTAAAWRGVTVASRQGTDNGDTKVADR